MTLNLKPEEVYLAALTGRCARPGSPTEAVAFATAVLGIAGAVDRPERRCKNCCNYEIDLSQGGYCGIDPTGMVNAYETNYAPHCPFFRPVTEESRAAANEF